MAVRLSSSAPACHGTGEFRGYSGRVSAPASSARARGNITKGQNAAIKGKETKEGNKAKGMAENLDAVIVYATKRRDKGSTFYSELDRGASTPTAAWTKNQVAIIRKDMAKDAEFFAKRKAEREGRCPGDRDQRHREALCPRRSDNRTSSRPIPPAEGLEDQARPPPPAGTPGRSTSRPQRCRGTAWARSWMANTSTRSMRHPADTVDLA